MPYVHNRPRTPRQHRRPWPCGRVPPGFASLGTTVCTLRRGGFNPRPAARCKAVSPVRARMGCPPPTGEHRIAGTAVPWQGPDQLLLAPGAHQLDRRSRVRADGIHAERPHHHNHFHCRRYCSFFFFFLLEPCPLLVAWVECIDTVARISHHVAGAAIVIYTQVPGLFDASSWQDTANIGTTLVVAVFVLAALLKETWHAGMTAGWHWQVHHPAQL